MTTDYIKNYENAYRGEPHWGASGIKFNKYRPSNVDGYYLHPDSERMLLLEAKYIKNGYADIDYGLDMRFKKMSKQVTIMVLWGTIDEDAYSKDKSIVKYNFTKIRIYNNGKCKEYDNVDQDFINGKIAEWETWSTKAKARTHKDLAQYHSSKLTNSEKLALIAQLQNEVNN